MCTCAGAQYIATANAGAKSEAQVKKVLEDVGFTEQLQKNSVLELSGGWRMKLALAGPMCICLCVCLSDGSVPMSMSVSPSLSMTWCL